MRLPYLTFIMAPTFRGIQEHAEKVKECAWIFQQAIECHVNERCELFDTHRNEVMRMESDADTIKISHSGLSAARNSDAGGQSAPAEVY